MIAIMRMMALAGGEWVIYLLLLCSVLALAIVIERAIVLSREKKSAEQVREIFLKFLEQEQNNHWSELARTLESNPSFVAKTLVSGLLNAKQGPESVEDQLWSAEIRYKQNLERRMVILGTLGNNAVYIGLFGTVLGVIKAFKDLATAQGAGPEVVMQGLSEALIATAVGLLVALPCTAAYNIIQRHIKDLCTDAESVGRIFLARLKSKTHSHN